MSEKTSATSRHPTGWRKWLYRLLAMTLAPALLLLGLELLLCLCGYGHAASFFLPSKSGEQTVFIDNPNFGRRFFPPGIVLEVEPLLLAGTKTAGTYRIFILGESAAMGYPDTSFQFGRILQAMLQDRYPDTEFEVVNTAMEAINSHVILPIARDCAEREPDLFVVYMGNSEVVGPHGPAGVLGPFLPSLQLIRAGFAVKATRTGQLLANLMQRRTDTGPTSRGWIGMPMFVGSAVPADDPRLQAVYAHFSRNLQDICSVGQQAGAKVLVCTVASNLKDCAPFASVPATDGTAEQSAAWQDLVDKGVARASAGDQAAALSSYRRALAMGDKPADLHFRLARCLAALKNPDEAHRHYVLARDRDALRFRTDSRLNEAIRATATGREDEGVYLVDVARSFDKASADGPPGDELFYDHAHLTFEGNYRLAHAVLEQIVRVLPDSVHAHGRPADPFLSVEDCRQRLSFTAWNRKKALSAIEAMGRKPPFTSQLDHAERLQRWRSELAKLKKQLAGGADAVALTIYRRALERNPTDLVLRKDFALQLWEKGLPVDAVRHTREALKLMPHDPILRTQLAQFLGKQGELQEAMESCAESLRLLPDNPDILTVTGQLLNTAGKPDQAVVLFTHALKFKPHHAAAHANLGAALALLKQYDRAIAECNEALRIDPDFIPAQLTLGRILSRMGRFDDAVNYFRAALRLDPDDPDAHAEIAVLLQEGNLAEAISHVEEALRQRPEWREMTQTLQELRQRQKKAP